MVMVSASSYPVHEQPPCPFSLQTSEIASTHLRRPIAEQEVYRGEQEDFNPFSSEAIFMLLHQWGRGKGNDWVVSPTYGILQGCCEDKLGE